MNKKYTKEILDPLIKESGSIRQVIINLGLNPNIGGIYNTIKNKIKEFNIDTSHFHGMLWNKGKLFYNWENVSKLFTENSKYKSGRPISTMNLKNQLFKYGIKEFICENCLNTYWLNSIIPLHLHHINGNRFDNRIENLQLLCPNCHALTENYCGKNIKKKKPKSKKKI